jgi:hypothetical protein
LEAAKVESEDEDEGAENDQDLVVEESPAGKRKRSDDEEVNESSEDGDIHQVKKVKTGESSDSTEISSETDSGNDTESSKKRKRDEGEGIGGGESRKKVKTGESSSSTEVSSGTESGIETVSSKKRKRDDDEDTEGGEPRQKVKRVVFDLTKNDEFSVIEPAEDMPEFFPTIKRAESEESESSKLSSVPEDCSSSGSPILVEPVEEAEEVQHIDWEEKYRILDGDSIMVMIKKIMNKQIEKKKREKYVAKKRDSPRATARVKSYIGFLVY